MVFQQTLRSQIIFCKNFTESLAAERIPHSESGHLGWHWNQEGSEEPVCEAPAVHRWHWHRLWRPRHRRGQRDLQFFFNIFELYITCSAVQGRIQLILAAQMNDLEIRQKLWQDLANGMVHISGTQAATDDQKHRLVGSESAKSAGGFLITAAQLLTNRRTGQYSLSGWKILHCLREVAADPGGERCVSLLARPGVISDS